LDPNLFFNMVWPTLSALVVVPLTGWIKGLIPEDLPISSVLISVVLNLILILSARALLGMEMGVEMWWPYVIAGQAVSQVSHASMKTYNRYRAANMAAGMYPQEGVTEDEEDAA